MEKLVQIPSVRSLFFFFWQKLYPGRIVAVRPEDVT